jgi:hypothetical protein
LGDLNVMTELREIRFDSVVRIYVAKDRTQWRAVVNTVMSLRDPLNQVNFLTSCATISSSRKAKLHGVIYLPLQEHKRNNKRFRFVEYWARYPKKLQFSGHVTAL